MMYKRSFDSPVGMLTVYADEKAITAIHFADDGGNDQTPLLLAAERQLGEYFAGRRREFDLPLSPQGTEFQLKVWDAVRKIPYGSTVSYKAIAKAVGNERACRAVGAANNRNSIPIIIPCHRVIGADGSLVGYADGLSIKQTLLAIENNAAHGE